MNTSADLKVLQDYFRESIVKTLTADKKIGMNLDLYNYPASIIKNSISGI